MKRQDPFRSQNEPQNNQRKRMHLNQQSEKKNQTPKPQYILNRKLANQMAMDKDIHIHEINGKQFFFPYAKLNPPQQNFIKAMFQCLDQKKNLLIQSPTGTGKTLSLLTGALAWADRFYNETSGGVFDNRIKIIYTSRAHSQLSQISKQLQKTPYRPRMLLFGSRQKMCINESIYPDSSSLQSNKYESWTHKCNIAVRLQQRYQKNPQAYKEDQIQTLDTLNFLASKAYLTQVQKQDLARTKEHYSDLQTRCVHYHAYQDKVDRDFFKEIGRTVLNNEKLKKMAQQRSPSLCPHYYPKRVKNWGTLYLMPYNYILDSRILQYSEGFLSGSIIIFDQGHNVPKTACQGYSFNFNSRLFEVAKRNITQKLNDNDFDADEQQMQNLIRQQQLQKEISQKSGNKKQMDQEAYEMLRLANEKDRKKEPTQEEKKSLQKHVKFLIDVINNGIGNFQTYFNSERLDYKKTDSGFLESLGSSKSLGQMKKTSYWQAIRYIHTPERQKIHSLIEQIFFNQKINEYIGKTLKQRLQMIIDSLKYVISYFLKKEKKCFKIINMVRFYNLLKNILYDENHRDKFFLQITQSKKYDYKAKEFLFKGQIDIRCLAPQFSFQKLSSIGPRSIIITSGTLSPMNVFQKQLGLKFVKQQVGHVITEENILVRKVGRNLNGDVLKIDSQFYSGRDGLQFGNLKGLFELLISAVESIPNGVLVIVSSFSCLKHLENFYKHEFARQIRKRLQQIKPHVYFEPKTKLETTMERFYFNSQQGKGALLFCVCRAKLSQGIDFKDKLCRSVIFFGIPYVNKGDPFVVEKGDYLKKIKSQYASEWKFIEASKAINQGLGRAVRHATDYGSILLFDNRYEQTNRDSLPVVNNISEWIKKNWKVNNNIINLKNQLKGFYQKCQKMFPLKKFKEEEQQLQQGQLLLSDYF